MSWLAVPAVVAAAYYLMVLIAALRWRASTAGTDPGSECPPISILKPVHGRDPQFYEAILSHAVQDYPEFEILFGTREADDPALKDIALLALKFPHRSIRAVVVDTKAPNAKVGVLE